MKSIDTLQKRVKYIFTNPKLLNEALTHKSCKKPYDNERLEFLGDAVLDLLVGEYLFKKFPHFDEGELSKLRACIVNEKGFMKLAKSLSLGEYLYISSSEESNNGRNKPSILSNAFEALIGAIYLDDDIKQARRILYELLEENYANIDLQSLFVDYKTALQELTQERFGVLPDYEITGESGPDHKKSFEITLFIQQKNYAKAHGHSKKEAEQRCAEIAYKTLTQKAKKGKK